MEVRTRIAPSPTGQDLHIGNAYTALINYVFAKKSGGKFIIRIEDTDRTRFVEGSEERILSSLKWLGIAHVEGPDNGGEYAPYRQSERLSLYGEHAKKLIELSHAYYCFCTSERLETMRKDQEARKLPPMYDGLCKHIPKEEAQKKIDEGAKYVIRLNVPEEGVTSFTDIVRGTISFENALIDDQVLLKSDGFPTYHLGVVVDDHLMNITHIVRGEEWISSTPKHILLYQFFGWELPVFAHVSLLRNPDKSKLSKRKNPVWVSWFKEQGFLPEALLNYLATMAWSFPEGKDIFSLEEMIKEFRLEDLQTTAPIFDLEKLKWINKQYLMVKPLNMFVTLASGASGYSRNVNFQQISEGTASLIQPRISTLAEYDSMVGFLFKPPKEYEIEINKESLNLVKNALEKCEWNHLEMEKSIRAVADASGVKSKDLFMTLRVAVTGKTVGPPLLESLELLGKEKTLARLIVQ
ncbi:glutamate--tRNA ligase [Candidatus Gottesmanbacteria bacterium]|nr:glutamate--tRNA ligase [Candidatus Gottesmanbacteria bacterium]